MNAPNPSAGSRGFDSIDENAERSVVAALLVGPDLFSDLTERLQPEDFGTFALGEIFRAIIHCDDAGRPFTKITVMDELRSRRLLKKIGGEEYLNALIADAVNSEDIIAHADIVAEKSLSRRLWSTAREIATEAMDPTIPPSEALAHAETSVFELGAPRDETHFIEMTQSVNDALTEMAKIRTSLLAGHSTGFSTLDRYTAGIQPGQLWVVAARPGVGKTSFMLQMARHVAETAGPVLFITYEMSSIELTLRLMSQDLGFDSRRIRDGEIPEGMEYDVARVAERLKMLGANLTYQDLPPETIGRVRSLVRRRSRQMPLAAIFIDYIQLMSAEMRGRDENRATEVSAISRGLKRLSVEVAPVIAAAQLNRNVETRGGFPRLSDLRESGSIEQDSNLVLFLHRPHASDPTADPDVADLLIAKQRGGQSGVTIPLTFHGPAQRFDDDGGQGRRNGAPAGMMRGNGNGNGTGNGGRRPWDRDRGEEPF